jgi:Conjugative transposon protein TcpC
MVAGAVVLGALGVAKPAASSTRPVAVGERPRWDVAGFASSFVAVFVGAGEQDAADLAPFLGSKPTELAGLAGGDWYASRVTTTDITDVTPGRWMVKVAADLLRRESDPTSAFVSVGVRYFAVDVVAQGNKLVAARLPSLVDAPEPGAVIDDGWPTATSPAPNDALADTTSRFLTALLTGNGELGRYAAPGSGLRAAAPTFDHVRIEKLSVKGDTTKRRVRVWAIGTAGKADMALTYDLTLARTDGRWEVTAIGPPATQPEVQPAVPSVVQPSTITTLGS